MQIKARTNRKPAMAGRLASGAAVLAVVCAFGFVLNLAFAADQVENSMKGFQAPLDYFPAPHELQMRSYLEAEEMEMGPNGTVILHIAKLHTFHEDGSREMIVNAPQCLYDYGKRVVTSAGALHVQTWDDANKRALQVRGTNGFYWQQTNAFLIVSNQQITTISGSLTNSF
jgi:hypothetical protein